MRDLSVRQVDPTRLVDIQMEPNGDLKVLNGDFALCDGTDAIEQAVRWRILTPLGSWGLAPNCGSRLLDYASSPNTPPVADMVAAEIERALTRDGYLGPGELQVEVAPISTYELLVLLRVAHFSENPITVRFDLDLRTGQISNWTRVAS